MPIKSPAEIAAEAYDQGFEQGRRDNYAGTLKVTHVQVYTLDTPTGKTRALCRVVLNEQLQLTGLRVVDGANGLFLSYPNDPSYKGEDYRSLFYPVTRELREHIEQEVLKKYHEIGETRCQNS